MNKSIVNWDNLFAQKDSFMNAKPFKFTFIENVFDNNFYKELYETYPKLDDTWDVVSTFTKSMYAKFWNIPDNESSQDTKSTFTKEWKDLQIYINSEEFLSNIRKLTGTTVNRVKNFQFVLYKKGGFQLPHIHNVGPNTVILMVYFSKGWKKGDAGGTYVATEPDESKIIFEPYNLDNSLVIFQDSPKAAHGARIITKDVERRALQIYLEEYDEENGWSGVDPHSKEFQSKLPEI
jgi:hypothetical protein|tara:strand:+ start:644 stop:1348 length:705 start_codon:yes stop_codon:yes gene_type:complete